MYFCRRKVIIYMEETLYSKLETTALFSGLTANAIEEQLKSLHYSLQKVPAKTLFMAEHQPLHEMILVLEGKVSARMGSSRSKSLMVDYLKPGFMLAPAFILSDHNQLPVEVRAVEESMLFCMPKADFSQLINTNNLVLFNFLDILSNINCFLMNKIRMIYMASIKEKIASFLLHNVEASHNNIVPLRLSRKQLADRFGVQKSSLIRTLNDLEHSNLIFVREKEIVVLNVVGLKNVLKGK